MRILMLAVLALLIAAPVAKADQATMTFDVRLLGARIGVLTIAANDTDRNYAARSVFKTVGIAGALKHMRADVTVQGKMRDEVMQPIRYDEAIDDGTRVTDVAVQFSPGTPRLISGDTGSSAPPASADSLGRAIDPLTGLVLLLRDQSEEITCDFGADIFDGHRLARIELNRAEPRGDGVICHGSYRRVSGYTSSESRSRKVPLSISYVPHKGSYRADRVRVETRYGAAVVQQR